MQEDTSRGSDLSGFATTATAAAGFAYLAHQANAGRTFASADRVDARWEQAQYFREATTQLDETPTPTQLHRDFVASIRPTEPHPTVTMPNNLYTASAGLAMTICAVQAVHYLRRGVSRIFRRR